MTISDGKPRRGARDGLRSAGEPPQSAGREGESAAAPAVPIEPAAVLPADASPPGPGLQSAAAPLEPIADSPSATLSQLQAIEPADLAEVAWGTLTEAQRALARGLEQTAAEMAGMTQSGVSAGSEAAIALLGARSFAEVVEINAGLAQRSVGSILQCSARLSEIGLRAAFDLGRPFLSQLGSSWPTSRAA